MSNRPTDLPDWATDANHPAGSNEWNGQPNKVKPSAARITEGFDPNDDLFVEEENWILNNHGQWIGYLSGINDGRERDLVVIEDDFTGDTLDTGKWKNTAGAGLTFVQADPAIGNVRLDPSAASQSVVSQAMSPATLDFHLTFIFRPTNLTSGSYDSIALGLINLGVADECVWFRISRGIPGMNPVLLQYAGHTRGGGTEVATSFTPDPAQFATYEIVRSGSTLTFLINGVQVYQDTAYTHSLTSVQLGVLASGVSSTAQCDLDLVRGVFFRGDSGAGVAVTSVAAHEEKGFAAITAGVGAEHEYHDVVFAQPFPAATGAGGYEVDVQISLTTDGDPVPSPAITNKTTTGFRIRFSAAFNGEVRWSAK